MPEHANGVGCERSERSEKQMKREKQRSPGAERAQGDADSLHTMPRLHRSSVARSSHFAAQAQCFAGTGADFIRGRTLDVRAQNTIILGLRRWEQDLDPPYSARVKQRLCANGIREFHAEYAQGGAEIKSGV
ncbi:hypothetical protein C8R44DRAFT_736554 [Mycena epipterygia]|nr:hypothetical protein C8R44DRAFT_736554 [Mycena epipterygia]